MNYQAVGNRCAVNLKSLELPIAEQQAFEILGQKGFEKKEVDIIKIARTCIGKSQYRRGARLHETPDFFDCSSFIKWLYGQRGIWLPRRSIQQRELGEAIEPGDIVAGDIIFTSGWIDYYLNDPSDGVGHVGIATDDGTVIHAANRKAGIVETSVEHFIVKEKFRGIRRYIPKDADVITLLTPPHREVETSDDIRWIILQSLP